MTLGGQRPLARGHVPAQAKLPEAAPGAEGTNNTKSHDPWLLV